MATKLCKFHRLIEFGVINLIHRRYGSKIGQMDNIDLSSGFPSPVMGSQHRYSWLEEVTPCFQVSGQQVTVLHEPTQFYDALKEKINLAKKRIVLASLYLGTGNLEQQLVECLTDACHRVKQSENKDLEVTLLLDYTRGSRGTQNSRTLLLPLLKTFDASVRVSLYHTPNLRGVLKRILPEKYNETIGLTHLKVYLFDDSVILSGANLSNDYFMKRQDRYIVVDDCVELADFLTSLVKTVSSFSLRLQADDTVTVPEEFGVHPFEGDETDFKWRAREKVEKLLACDTWRKRHKLSTNVNDKENLLDHHRQSRSQKSCSTESGKLVNNESVPRLGSQSKVDMDTWIYPLVQMGQLGIRHDEHVMRRLLRSAEGGERIRLASGYFNLTDRYKEIILHQSKADYEILLASPEVNGFFGARGVMGGIAPAYVYIAKCFYEMFCWYQQQCRIRLYEYYRDCWTFHVKGLWYYPRNELLPDFTLVGSTNFGYRSEYRDLETQLAIVTQNQNLREELHKENDRLFELSSHVTGETFQRPDRHIPLWVKIVTPVIKHFF